jgi:hypothetical protein
MIVGDAVRESLGSVGCRSQIAKWRMTCDLEACKVGGRGGGSGICIKGRDRCARQTVWG